MDTIAQAVVLGVGSGALDALLALGIVLIYRTTGVLNFAQSATGTLAAYVIWSVSVGHPLLLALGMGVLVGAVTGMFSQRVIGGIRSREPALASAVGTLALAIIIEQVVRVGWGAAPLSAPFPAPFPLTPAVTIGTVTIATLTLAGTIAAVALTVGTMAFLQYTRTGMMLRALADSSEAARLCGARPGQLVAIVWAIAGACAAVAGFFVFQLQPGPSALDTFFVAALLAAVLGGLRSIAAAFVGACILESLRNLYTLYAPAEIVTYAQTFLILILIAVLVLAPRRWLAGPAGRSV